MEQYMKSLMMLENLVGYVGSGVGYNLKGGHSPEATIEKAKTLHTAIHDSRVYEIDGRIGRMFALILNKPRRIELPFQSLYLDMEITYKGWHYAGLMLGMIDNRVLNFPLSEESAEKLLKTISRVGSDVWVSCLRYKLVRNGEDTELEIIDFFLNTKTEKDDIINKSGGGDAINILRRVIMNFNDFLEHPEVKLVEHKPNNNEKRIKRGKRPMPESTTIVVRGDLKIYVDSIQPKNGESDSLDGCFEVAGHWRRFRHHRFTNKRGGKTFIHPYIKGVGNPQVKVRKIPLGKLKRVEAI